MKKHYQVLIVGGGSAGITVAAHLLNQDASLDVGIVEPSEKHYYQPLWTLVGGGVFAKEETERNEADYIPRGATWIKDAVDTFDPENNAIKTSSGDELTYDALVVTAGIQINWGGIKGLEGNVGKHGICSNYSYDTCESTFENIRNLKKGTAIFTQPHTPIKCGGAPQKICYIAEDYFRNHGVRDDIKVVFASAKGGIFPVPKYKASLERVIERKQIETKFCHTLIELRPEKREAVFGIMKDEQLSDETVTMKYDMIHVTPMMGPPDFIKNSPISDEVGWVSVDMYTTQHTKFPNIFSLGDCSNLPTSKTGAAIRKQAPTTVENLRAFLADKPLTAKYDGYTSCPLVTGYGSLILAEFDYDKNPAETFPFDQSEERYSMYALKAYGLPRMYWHGMLRGRA